MGGINGDAIFRKKNHFNILDFAIAQTHKVTMVKPI